MHSSAETGTIAEIRVPRETVNDDLVTVQSWAVKHGDRVRAQDVVVHIETSKAVLDVEAESDGFVEILHAAGSEVPIGELVGRIHPNGLAGAGAPSVGGGAGAPAGGGATAAGTTISKKAQALIDQYGIDAGVFEGKGLIREREVIAYLEERAQQAEEAPAREAEPGVHVEASAASSSGGVASSAHQKKGLLGDAATAAGERGKPLVWVILNYIFRNWLLNNLVRWSPRGVITVVHKLRGVKMGQDCFIDPSATLETAYPEHIKMGNDVRVTVGAIIMCHIKAPHYLRETGIMPPVVKDVILEDHCFIGVNSVVMPGVTVGKASVVASGSVVVSDVAPYTMVAGNPAKVIRRFPNPEGDG